MFRLITSTPRCLMRVLRAWLAHSVVKRTAQVNKSPRTHRWRLKDSGILC